MAEAMTAESMQRVPHSASTFDLQKRPSTEWWPEESPHASPASSPQTTPVFHRRSRESKNRNKMQRSSSTDVLNDPPKFYLRSRSQATTSDVAVPGGPGYVAGKRKGSKEPGLRNFFHSRKYKKDSAFQLHYPKSAESLRELLKNPSLNVNLCNESGDAPIQSIVQHKRSKRMDLLITLLVHSTVNVSLPGKNDNTSLHYAVMEGEEGVIKLLIAFGADLNARNCSHKTPLDIAINKSNKDIIALLVSVGGSTGEVVMQQSITFKWKMSRLIDFEDSLARSGSTVNPNEGVDGAPQERMRPRSCHSFSLSELQNGKAEQSLHDRVKSHINITLERSGSFSENIDEAIAIAMQQKELSKYRKTQQEHTAFEVKGGSRILSLDGGGMRGLIQVEVLQQLEQKTGRKITELFDWIVGTSTGGVIALALVYGRRSLHELRQLYFKLKDRVFGHDRAGVAYNSEALEELFKEEFGENVSMDDVKFPRVLISAVNKRNNPPVLHFFNNCFDDEFSHQMVWKVARYTSAAPMMFTSFEDYVDGGVLVNNPCESGLTAIRNFHRQQHRIFDLAVVVSVGTGSFPPEELGKTDAQKFLFFGKHWFKNGIEGLKKQAANLITLLTSALVDSELVADNCRSRLLEQGVPFYRFSPSLRQVISAGETGTDKLVSMIIKTRLDSTGAVMDELVQMFHVIADLTRKLRARRRCESRAAKLAVVAEVN